MAHRTIEGTDQNDHLSGTDGEDYIYGGAGADTMKGFDGDDIFNVDQEHDVVVEAGTEGAGNDTVRSQVDYTLGANLENLSLIFKQNGEPHAVKGVGNELGNRINGNELNNVVVGRAGDDSLFGRAGNDTVKGNDGFDLVHGGAGKDTLYGGKGNDVLLGKTGKDTLYGGAGHDELIGGARGDVMQGQRGNDRYFVVGKHDRIKESRDEGLDVVLGRAAHVNGVPKPKFSHTLGANFEALTLLDSADASLTGNDLDNLIVSSDGDDTLKGLRGNDILQASAGHDELTDTRGNSLLDGGHGNDALNGGDGRELFIGGAGTDIIDTGTGADIIAFNSGDGHDLVKASIGKDNTISIGQASYADMVFRKSGNDLLFGVSASDEITLKGWYSSNKNRNVANLQVVIEGTAEYNGSGPMNDNKIEQFDFAGLAGAFDAARAATPGLTSWNLSNALMSFHLGGSDTAAIGGDLAYQYALNGSLSAFSMTPALAILGSGDFAAGMQALHPASELDDGSPRLI